MKNTVFGEVNTKSKDINKYIPVILIVISMIILLIRSTYSFCWSDETFYLATTKRFYDGDSIFYHEWFPTQLSSLLLLPLYSLYVGIVGSSTGVLLFNRIIFVILESVSAYFVYRLLSKNHGIFIGCIASLFTQWYVHLNIATLSYYTITIHCFLLAMLIIYDCYINKNSNLKLIIAGFLFAISVLCLPTMCVAYFIIVFAGFLITALAKFIPNAKFIADFSKKLDFIHTFIYTLFGIIIPAAIFFIYMLTHVSIKNFINSIPFVLSDDEHETNFRYPIKKMYLSINESFGKIGYICYLFTACALLIFAIMLISNYVKNENLKEKISSFLLLIKPVIFIADLVLFILYLYTCYKYTGYIFSAILMFTTPLFLITEKKNYKLFILTYLSGLIYSLVFSYSSNGMLYILSMGHFICSIGCIVFIYDFINELKENRTFNILNKIYIPLISAILVICTLDICTLRIVNIYRDDSIKNLNALIHEGPAKGLRTSDEHLKMYEEVILTIDEYCMEDNDNKTLLISKLLPFGYLESNMKIAAPTVWRNPLGSTRLKEYYEIHSDRYPDVIYVLNEEYGTYETCGDVERDPIPNANDDEGYIYDLISSYGYEAIHVPSGIIYKKH